MTVNTQELRDLADTLNGILLPEGYNRQALKDAAVALPALLDEIDALRAALHTLICEVVGLAEESEGVYGLHLNGDPSPWEELLPGGRFERLTSLHDAEALIAPPQGETA